MDNPIGESGVLDVGQICPLTPKNTLSRHGTPAPMGWKIIVDSETCGCEYSDRIDSYGYEEYASWCSITNKRCTEDNCPRSISKIIINLIEKEIEES